MENFIFNLDQERNQNSHIQIHQALLEKFAFWHEDPDSGQFKSRVKVVYCLDLNSKKIDVKKIKKLGTQLGYFTDREEIELSLVESEFMEVINSMDDENKLLNNLSMNEQKIISFANLLLNRSEQIQKQLHLLAKGLFVEKYKCNNDLLEKYPISIKPDNLIDDNHGVTLLVNHTQANLVIPRNGFYVSMPMGYCGIIYVLPINTKKAIVIYNKNEFKHYIYDVYDENAIRKLNINALLMEKAVDSSFIVSYTQKELEELKKFIETAQWLQYK